MLYLKTNLWLNSLKGKHPNFLTNMRLKKPHARGFFGVF
jgi:hypothetical protein